MQFQKSRFLTEPPSSLVILVVFMQSRPSLLKGDMQYISLNLVTVDKNEGDFRKRHYVSIETKIHTCGR